jgi:hypothetical protein
MSKVYNKCYYIVATVNGEHYFQEGGYTEAEINQWINDFDIDKFLADEATDEEYCGPKEGHFSVYRQGSLTIEEAIDIGYAYVRGDSVVYDYAKASPEAKAKYELRKAQIQAELDAEFGEDEDPLVCLKPFAKVVA